MSAVIIVTAGEAEAISLGTTELRIHEDGAGLGGVLSLVGATVPPNTDGPPQHVHATFAELFHVTSGTLRVHSASTHVDVAAGGTASIPTGVPHTYSNPGDEPVSFVIVTSSDTVPQLF